MERNGGHFKVGLASGSLQIQIFLQAMVQCTYDTRDTEYTVRVPCLRTPRVSHGWGKWSKTVVENIQKRKEKEGKGESREETESNKRIRRSLRNHWRLRIDGNSFVIASGPLRSIYVEFPARFHGLPKDLSRGKSVSFVRLNETRSDQEWKDGLSNCWNNRSPNY